MGIIMAHRFRVKIVNFGSEKDLNEALVDAILNGSGPDIFIDPYNWLGEIGNPGMVSAYCLPNECPECTGPNPPLWCKSAFPDFKTSFNPDFAISGLCAEDSECPWISQNPPPRWCIRTQVMEHKGMTS